MSETTEVKNPKPAIVELAAKLKNGMTVDANGIVSVDKDLFKNTLPEGLDLKTVDSVFDHTTQLTAAFTLATGELGESALKKDKKLDSVESSMKMSRHGDITTKYDRKVERMVRNPSNPDAAPRPVTQWGVTTTRLKLTAGKNSGELKRVRQSIMDSAAKAFGS